ncbi:hypothetical protein AB7M18_005200 [Pseudomonas viridiflava]
MVKLVVERRCFQRPFAVKHGQWAEGAGFVDVGAIPVGCAFGDEPFALPEEFGSVAVDSLFDPAAKGVVLVGRGTAARQAYADQAVLEAISIAKFFLRYKISMEAKFTVVPQQPSLT